MLHADDLLLLGIPSYILSDSSMRKMDDHLPRFMLNTIVLICAVQINCMYLLIALFPMTALLSGVMEETLKKVHRIVVLCDAFLIVYRYHCHEGI